MRKLKVATILFLAGTAVCLCALLVLVLSGSGVGEGGFFEGGSGLRDGDYALVLEKEISSEGLNSLKIDYGMNSNDVYFYQGEGESVVIREYMNFTPDEKQISSLEEKDGTLLVRGARRKRFGFFFVSAGDAYTEIYLPADLAGQLENINVKTVSGEIMSDISFTVQKAFTVSSTSGDFSFPAVKAGEIQLSSTSGNIHMETLQAEKTSVSTTSGDIELGQTEGNAKISTTSGNVRLERTEGDIYASSVSGDISLGVADGDMDISSTSGIVRLREGKGRFDGDTISGDIRIEALDGSFQMNTTSGDVTLSAGNGWGTAETVSGDVKMFLGSLDGDIAVSTTSGNVDISLPDNASFTLNFDSTSGECHTFFDEQLTFNKKGNQAEGQYGSGENAVRVSTLSGDLRITE